MTLRRAIRRLRLKVGDTVLIHHSLAHLVHIGRLKGPVPAPIIIVNNKKDVQRLPFEELEKIYFQAKEAHSMIEKAVESFLGEKGNG